MQRTAAVSAPEARITSEAAAYAGLSLATFAWASAFIAGKYVLKEMTPLTAGGVRYLVASSVLLPLAWPSRPNLAGLRQVLLPLCMMVTCGGLLYQWLFLLALERTSATNASLLIALNPVFTMLLSPLVGERLERARIGGVLLALAGAATVITRGQWSQVGDLAGHANSGDLIAVAAAVCWASFNVASRRVVHVLSAAATNALVYGIGGVVLTAVALPENPLQQLAHASLPALAGIAVMAIGSSVLAGQLFLIGVRVVGVSRTVVFVYFIPVLTAIASVFWLGETFTGPQALGGAAVLAGVYWTTRRS
ncbi:MAG: DMT family transporter [Deltaproteobacteria bacterium]|nr:DMT family transporter [Deltaproteobacteria bacterium]